MKNAFAIGALLAGLVFVPAQASEFGLLLDKEIGRAQAFSGAASQGCQDRGGCVGPGYDRRVLPGVWDAAIGAGVHAPGCSGRRPGPDGRRLFTDEASLARSLRGAPKHPSPPSLSPLRVASRCGRTGPRGAG